MKKFITLLIILVLVSIMVPTLSSCTPRERVLKICNWEDYIGPDVIKDFEAYKEITGEKIKVKYDPTETNEDMLALIAVGHSDYDLLCPSDYMIEKMIKEDLCLKINKDLGNDINGVAITNYMSLQSEFSQHRDYDPTNEYSVGYMWGSMGILYNSKLVDEEITSWSSMWDSKYSGQILMKNSVRDSFVPAAIYANWATLADLRMQNTSAEEYNARLTELINDKTAAGINLTKNALVTQKPYLKGYEVDSGKQDMIDGTAKMSLQWAGDAVYSISKNPDLKYVIPNEGSNVFFDGWVIPKYAGNKRAAELFINFICKPSIAIDNMEEIGYTSVISSPEIIAYLNATYPNMATIDLSYFFGEAGASVHADPNMYPSNETIQRLALMRDFGAQDVAISTMWNEVKSS